MVIIRRFAVFFGPFDLFGPKIADNIVTRVIIAIAHAAFIQLSIGIQLIVATGRSTNAIDTFIKTFVTASGSVFHLRTEMKRNE